VGATKRSRGSRRLHPAVLALALAVALAGSLAAVITTLLSTETLVHVWETTGDRTKLLSPLPGTRFGAGNARTATSIVVDDEHHYQQMAGFGAAITDSSAYVLTHDMSRAQRAAVMTELFDPVHGIGLNYLREPIGATDFSTADYTEDDAPAGQTDPTLAHFSIAHDLQDMIPVLKQALAINPKIQIVATPWSAPAWMKTNKWLIGGTLDPAYLGAYAHYLVKFVQAYAAHGIRISAVTMQNEPDSSPSGYPGMALSAVQEADLAPVLGQDLAAAGLHTKILGFDSDWSDASYALNLLDSPTASRYLAGTAFHCYEGEPDAQLSVEEAVPAKGIYETECSAYDAYPKFDSDLVNDTRTLVIDSIRDWSKTVLLWNLVLNQRFGPTNGGCADCIPNVTINSSTGVATYNVGHYVLGQVSRFVKPGAYRIASTSPAAGLDTVAFQNPDGGVVLLVLNSAGSGQNVTIRWDGQSFTEAIPATSVQTLTWSS
jgi:glucosylceramidase